MRTLHLFAGAGGGLLADLILGHQPIAAVEWDAYACEVLRERRDEGWFPGLQVHEGDVRLFDPSQYAGKVDCIHAGFPCQDISTAGKGAGITGTRSGLVREVFRAIDAIRPRFVFLENSPAIRTRGRHVVLGELVARGYAYRDGILAASDIGACHKRTRWWCLAYAKQPQTNSIGGATKRGRQPMGRDKQATFSEDREASPDSPIGCIANVPDCSGEDVANPESVGWNDGNDSQLQRPPSRKKHPPTSTSSDFNNVEKGWWSLEPDFRGMAYGMASWLDRYWNPIEEKEIMAYVISYENKGYSVEALCGLWINNVQEKIRGAFGGSISFRQAAILLFGLCWKEGRCNEADLFVEGSQAARDGMRVLRICRTVASASRRPGFYKQLNSEYPNVMQELPRFLARSREEDWKENSWANASPRVAHGLANRVDRIKAIGNGQVPLQAAVAWRLLGGP